MNNGEIAEIFEEIADLLDLTGDNPFRIRAYRNAARTMRNCLEPMSEMVKGGKKLADLPGIGTDLENKIKTLLEHKRLPLLESLRLQVPDEIRNLLRIPSLGPKKIMRLYRELNLRSVEDLREAVEDHRVEQLKGFGERTAAKILAGINILKQNSGRILISEANRLAMTLSQHLSSTPGVAHFAIAGSFRRRKGTIGDLDLLAVCKSTEMLMDCLANFESVSIIEARGSTRMTVRLKNSFQVDLRIVPEQSWGAALLYFTGPKLHNIELRQRAIALGFKLNEYGLYSGDKIVAGESEKEVYRALGLDWIPPEMREHSNVIEMAENRRLPSLISAQAMIGDLHVHTRFTDGRDSLSAMALAAQNRGYQYLAFTDHSKRATVANGLDVNGLEAYWDEIDRTQDEFTKIKLLKGVELDILENGKLDLPDSTISKADWIIAAIHYGQAQSREEITRRLINAIKNRYVSAIAHPSGRVIGQRESYNADFEQVFKAAADYGCALEINGQPSRLDLSDRLLELACKYPVSFVLNSDAHSVEELTYMNYAVDQARRGGLSEDQILNAHSFWQFLDFKKGSDIRKA